MNLLSVLDILILFEDMKLTRLIHYLVWILPIKPTRRYHTCEIDVKPDRNGNKWMNKPATTVGPEGNIQTIDSTDTKTIIQSNTTQSPCPNPGLPFFFFFNKQSWAQQQHNLANLYVILQSKGMQCLVTSYQSQISFLVQNGCEIRVRHREACRVSSFKFQVADVAYAAQTVDTGSTFRPWTTELGDLVGHLLEIKLKQNNIIYYILYTDLCKSWINTEQALLNFTHLDQWNNNYGFVLLFITLTLQVQ